ncbi:MAG: hypothetical protein VB096_05900 [Pseudoflavonifractor sp.]|nr:hypothetical protein [Pseudoflavonifractor sp.]
MTGKIIDPESGVVVRVACDAEELESVLYKIQEGQSAPLIVQLGESGKMLHVIPY